MRCFECGNEYMEQSGAIKLNNRTIGDYTIELEKYFKCAGCGTLLFPDESARLITKKEEEIRNEFIRKLPVGDFITATEASEILGITKQAFHKNRRIKRGFIYSVVLAGKRLYNKKSVQLFKETNDGRFNLSNEPVNKIISYFGTVTSTQDYRSIDSQQAYNRGPFYRGYQTNEACGQYIH